jgi:hypothetical protein
MRFKEFLLNEQQAYLAQKVGNILTAIQELKDDAKSMGSRDLQAFTLAIVGQMRNVLHSSWPREELKFLKRIQKLAAALMKCIEDKGDLPGTVVGVASDLEKLVADMGVPINKLVPTEPSKDQTKDNKTVSDTENKSQQPQQAASQPPQAAQNLEPSPSATPPVGGTGQDMAAPPLGGSTGGLDAM